MPIYQYTCQECDHEFDVLVNRGDEVECPQCESKKLDKQASMPGMPQVKDALPSACGDPSLPPCGASGCRRTGRR